MRNVQSLKELKNFDLFIFLINNGPPAINNSLFAIAKLYVFFLKKFPLIQESESHNQENI